MIIGAIKEHNNNETRCALTPSVVKKLTQLGHTIILQKDIGTKSNYYDFQYKQSGATLSSSVEDIYTKSQIILQINPPQSKFFNLLKKKQLLIADFSNFEFINTNKLPQIIRLEKVPRTSITQTIDILSSQHTVRGYMGAMYALYHSPIIAPQLTTASTSVKASSALIIGASITGLQAVTIFKKQGCKLTILDINENNKELAQSVGANFAIASSSEEIINLIKNQNFILSAASNNNIAPKIIHPDFLQYLNNFSIIIDTTPNNIAILKNKEKTNRYLFYRNLQFETLCPTTASELWANNMLNLINTISKPNNQLDLSYDYISKMIYKG